MKQKLLLVLIIFGFITVPLLVSAHGLVPCGGINENPCTVTDIFVLIARATNWLIAVAGLYAVYQIINQGFYLIISVGNEEAITARKNALTNVVIGFVLILFAYMFVNTVVNVLLTRSLTPANHPECKLDLTNPLNYLTINQNPCTNLPDTGLHQ